MEIWKNIKGYEGLYQISSLGRLKALEKPRVTPSGGIGIRKEKIMKVYDNQRGYLQIVLRKNNIPKGHKLHRIVAEAFIDNPKKLEQINHINEIKYDNRVVNLEWCNATYNCNYGTRIHRISISLFDNSKTTKSVIQLSTTGEIIKKWISASDCGRNGFNRECVRDCCLFKQLTHKGYKWKYEAE